MALSKKQRREKIRQEQESTVRFKKRAKITTAVVAPILAIAALFSTMTMSLARNPVSPTKPGKKASSRSWEQEVELWKQHELSNPVTYSKIIRSKTYKEWAKDQPFVHFQNARRDFTGNPVYANYDTGYFVGLKDRFEFFFDFYNEIHQDFFTKQRNLEPVVLASRDLSQLQDSQALLPLLNLAYFLTRSNIRAKEATNIEDFEDLKTALEQGFGNCSSNSFTTYMNFQRLAYYTKKHNLIDKIRITRGFNPSKVRDLRVDHGWLDFFHQGQWFILECNGSNGQNGNALFGQPFNPRQNYLHGPTAVSPRFKKDYIRLCSMTFHYEPPKIAKYDFVYHTIPQAFEQELVAKSQ
jgi:hypothetical protein